MQRDGGPGGPGAGGNPTGGSFTGPAEALEIVGNHAYAYSGIISDAASGSAASSMLKFTTGNFYFVGHLNFTDDHVANDNMYLTMTLNGATVINLVYRSEPTAHDLNPYNVFIPSYTEVEIKFGSTGAVDGTTWLVGRIYRDR